MPPAEVHDAWAMNILKYRQRSVPSRIDNIGDFRCEYGGRARLAPAVFRMTIASFNVRAQRGCRSVAVDVRF
jgi:hypothetical protein